MSWRAFGLSVCVASCHPANVAGKPETACGLASTAIGTFAPLPGGSFEKAFQSVYGEEGSPMTLHVDGFSMQVHEVTIDQFAAFVAATGYLTDAERSAQAGAQGGGSAVFDLPSERAGQAQSWRLDAGATWRTPRGAGSSIEGRGSHPVVHVSKTDAQAYADWAGGRLPTEIEWEYAAALGLPEPGRATSSAYGPAGEPVANTWQGIFPLANTLQDGFEGTAPVGCFAPDRAELYDMIGNVWEWTDTPFGPGQHTIKGGSYLCADNFCRRYRPAARQPQDTDFSTSHIGFRIVRDEVSGG